MTGDPQVQIELDITAFVNGQLDGERRFAVADHLSRHPDRAAEVMAELSLTEGLRLAVARVESPPPPQLRLAADRAAARLGPRRSVRQALPVAAAVAMFALGWGAQGLLREPAPPGDAGDFAALLETALDAQEAVSLRIALSGELGPMPNDPERIAGRLGIDLPRLPDGWSILAAQVVATPERPGVALVIVTPDLGEILLLGVMRSLDGPDMPAAATSRDGRALAFFERERTAYVLVDSAGTAADLRLGAETLRHRFN
jgi:hypothetical protein